MPRQYSALIIFFLFSISLCASNDMFGFSQSKYSIELLHPDFKNIKYDEAKKYCEKMAASNDSIFYQISESQNIFGLNEMRLLRVVDEYFVEEILYNFNFEDGPIEKVSIRFTSIKMVYQNEEFWSPFLKKFTKKRVEEQSLWGELFDICQEKVQEFERCFEQRDYTFDNISNYRNKAVVFKSSEGKYYKVTQWFGLKSLNIKYPQIEGLIPNL